MRIGLIAMSGIRVCDPELLALGMTLPGVLERGRVVASLPSLGLLTLAGMTPPGHDLTYHEIQEFQDLKCLPQDFDLVAISTLTPQIREAYALAERFRQNGTKVVMGGLHVTCLPEEAAEYCDAVIVGEGELHWADVVRDADNQRLQKRYDKRFGTFDLQHSPMPRFDLLDIQRYNRLTVQTSRGCPLKCEFCAGSILLTDKYKQKPIERVLAEIDEILKIWRRPFIEFADDNSFCNRKYWKSFLPKLAKRRIRWFTESDISIGEDDELLQMMHAAGCMQVLIGLESPDEASLQGIELKSDWKRRRWPQYRDAIHNIQRHGIAVNGCFILGLDGHDATIFDSVLAATEELQLFDVQITVQTAFPGTPLYERLKTAGRLLEPEAWERCTLFDVNFEPAQMSPDQLRSGLHDLVKRIYNPQALNHRRDRFLRAHFQPRQ
jgi:radical SAM superfamily enzyme YgiQ (UPF0313 family)